MELINSRIMHMINKIFLVLNIRSEQTTRNGVQMKKVLILVLVVMTLVGCGSSNEAKTNLPAESVVTEVTETELNAIEHSSTEDVAIEVESKFKRPLHKKPLHDVKNVLSFIPKEHYYNDKGALVVTGYMHNDIEYKATGTRVRLLEIYNEEDELIASNCFGYVEYGVNFEPGEDVELTYVFPAMTVAIGDDDLDTITTVLKTSSFVYYD